jgi:hypothetical protein
MVMKKGLTYLIVFSLLLGCAPSPYVTNIKTVYESPTVPGFEKDRLYFDKLSQKLDECYKSNNPLSDFYENALLIIIDPYIICNDEIVSFVDQKLKEYNDNINECKKIALDGFKKIGVSPKQNDLMPLRFELASISYGDEYRENIARQVKKEIGNIEDSFWAGFYKKYKEEREKNYNEIVLVMQGQQDIQFINVYINIYNYQRQEVVKIKLGLDLYEKFKKYVSSDWNKFLISLTANQKPLFDKVISDNFKSQKDNVNLFRNLKDDQVYNLGYCLGRIKLLSVLEEDMKTRIQKAEALEKWLSENKRKAEQSLQYQEKIRTDRAQAITSALLIGLAGGLSAYGDYLSRPRTQISIQQPPSIPTTPQPSYGAGGGTTSQDAYINTLKAYGWRP